AAPAIDRLVRIANYANVLLLLSKQANQRELKLIRVLIFIDQQVPEAVVVALAHFGHIAQKAHGLYEQIVEIQRVVLVQTFFVESKNPGDRRAPLIYILRFSRKAL